MAAAKSERTWAENSTKSLCQPSDSAIFNFLEFAEFCLFCASFSDNLGTVEGGVHDCNKLNRIFIGARVRVMGSFLRDLSYTGRVLWNKRGESGSDCGRSGLGKILSSTLNPSKIASPSPRCCVYTLKSLLIASTGEFL